VFVGFVRESNSLDAGPHCEKYPYFRILTVSVPCTFVLVNLIHCNVGQRLRYSADLRIQTYIDPVPLKFDKFATKYPRIYGYYSQCSCNNTFHHCLGDVPSASATLRRLGADRLTDRQTEWRDCVARCNKPRRHCDG